MVDKPMLEKTPIPSSNRSVLLSKEPCDRATLDEPMFEQQDVDPRIIEYLEHDKDVFPNTVEKNDNKRSHKLSRKNPDLGFVNKRDGRLISRSLWNKTRAHVSSIKVIEVHESSDSEIKNFLEEEDPTYHKLNTSQAYDFVGNIPPCLKHNKGFSGLKLSQNPIVDNGSVLTHNHMSPQSIVPDPRCEVCLFWIEKYYTDVPSLQARIKTLTT